MKKEKLEIQKIEEKGAVVKSHLRRAMVKIVLTNLVNLALVIVVMLLLSELPKSAEKIKELRGAQLVAQESSDAAIIRGDLEKNQEKIDKLQNLYVNYSGFVEFVEQINSLKASGTITEVTFPDSQNQVRTGNQTAVPILVVMQGNQEAVNTSLSQVLDLPFLLSPQSVEIEGNRDNMIMSFGFYLLTNEKFPEN